MKMKMLANSVGAAAPAISWLNFISFGTNPLSRSDLMMVAVAFKPRMNTQTNIRRVATAESKVAFNRRSATFPCAFNRGMNPTATFKTALRDFLWLASLFLALNSSAQPSGTASAMPPGLVNEWLRDQSSIFNPWDLGGQFRARYELKENGGSSGGSFPNRDFRRNGVDNDNSF